MEKEEHQERWWQLCAACGERIGIYEPLVIERPDGPQRSSYLNLARAERAGPWQLLHSQCATAGS